MTTFFSLLLTKQMLGKQLNTQEIKNLTLTLYVSVATPQWHFQVTYSHKYLHRITHCRMAHISHTHLFTFK